MNKNKWQASHTALTTATPEAIWSRWTNVEGWPEEDIHLKWARLDGPFRVGTKITMKPAGSPQSSVTITEATPNKSFTTVGNIPFGKLIISHDIESKNVKTSFTHTISVTGPLRTIFAKLVAQKLADGLPAKMQNIAQLAEKL